MPIRLAGLALVALIALSRGEAQPVSEPVVRTIWPAAQDGAMMSPDGTLVAFVDWNVSQVAVRDVATATERLLPDTVRRRDCSQTGTRATSRATPSICGNPKDSHVETR